MPGPTLWEYSPFKSSGTPQAYSTFSMPRLSSPMASSSTLPCSSATSRQISSASRSSSILKRNITWARLAGGRSRQAGCASRAAAMARSTVAASPRATRRIASPVAGLNTSMLRSPATRSPAIQWLTSVMGSLLN